MSEPHKATEIPRNLVVNEDEEEAEEEVAKRLGDSKASFSREVLETLRDARGPP